MWDVGLNKVRNLGLWMGVGEFLRFRNVGNFMDMKAICTDELSVEEKCTIENQVLSPNIFSSGW